MSCSVRPPHLFSGTLSEGREETCSKKYLVQGAHSILLGLERLLPTLQFNECSWQVLTKPKALEHVHS